MRTKIPPTSDKTASSALEQALTKEATARARKFLAGINAYRRHPVQRQDALPDDIQVMHQIGTTRLLDYAPNALPNALPVLIIPSLINRYWILDLDQGQSLLRFMVKRGLRPLVVDWGEPGTQETAFTISDYITQRLMPFSDFIVANIASRHATLGYCMGGLLATALATLQPERSSALALLATPWDFHSASILPPEIFLGWATEMEPWLADGDLLPIEAMQAMFAWLQPTQAMVKFSRFAGLDQSSLEARRFVLAEDWLNDGVPLAAGVARDILNGWYGHNLTAAMEWQVGGQTINPADLSMPVRLIIPQRDRIVPPASSLPLAKMIRNAVISKPALGHIGLLASTSAPRTVWQPLTVWLRKNGKK